MRAIAVVVVTAVLGSTALAGSAQAEPKLGPAPVVADCLVYRGPSACIYNIGFIEMRLSQHILHVGDTLTANYSWGLSPTRGATPLRAGFGLSHQKCSGLPKQIGLGTTGSGSCTWKATKPTGAWVTSLGINLSQNASLGSYTENDYYAIIGKEPAIEGWVRREDSGTAQAGYRPGIPNLQIKINGPKFGRSIRTNENGYFFTTVQNPGAYRVTPVLTKKLKNGRSNSSAIDPESKVVNVSNNQVGRADFKVRDGIDVQAVATPASIPADGFHTAKIDVTVERFGEPVAGTYVSVFPNKSTSDPDPETVPVPARYCGAFGAWPNVNRGAEPHNKEFDLYTDADGKATFNVTTGTVPGKLAVRVWAKDGSGRLQTNSISDARKDVTIDNAPIGVNGPGGFGVTYGQLLTTANLAPADGYGSIPLQLAKLAPGSKLAGLAFTGIYGSGMNGVLVTPATERIPVSAGTVIGTSNGSVLASANLANTVLAPYGGYASLVKAGALPELLPFADWAKGETAAAAWSLRPQDGVIHFLGGWNQLGYPYDQQPGGC